MSMEDFQALFEAFVEGPISLWVYVALQLLSPLAVLGAAAAATIYARRSIIINRGTTKQRCTMDFLMDRSRDKRFSESYAIIRKIDKDPRLDIRFFAHEHKYEEQIAAENDPKKLETLMAEKKEHDEGIACLNYVLNQYEYMAVGIRRGIYDEDMLQAATRSSTLKAYAITKPFIEKSQELYGDSVYSKFRELAVRWKTPIP